MYMHAALSMTSLLVCETTRRMQEQAAQAAQQPCTVCNGGRLLSKTS